MPTYRSDLKMHENNYYKIEFFPPKNTIINHKYFNIKIIFVIIKYYYILYYYVQSKLKCLNDSKYIVEYNLKFMNFCDQI